MTCRSGSIDEFVLFRIRVHLRSEFYQVDKILSVFSGDENKTRRKFKTKISTDENFPIYGSIKGE